MSSETGEQDFLSSGATAKGAQLHLGRKQPFASCLTVGHWLSFLCPLEALREEGPNAEPVLSEQVASSSAPRPPSIPTCLP